MSRLCLYYLPEPERNRWVPGDRFVRPIIRRIVRGKPRPGGLDKVFINLRLGLDQCQIPYVVNPPFPTLRPDDRVAILGLGRHCLDGYRQPNPIVAGIGLMTHPTEWPTLCNDYPVARYLQHSDWCDAVYRPFFGDRCGIWPVGIDTATWRPDPSTPKQFDFLLYDKIRWEHSKYEAALIAPLRDSLRRANLSFMEIRYGSYAPQAYRQALHRCRAMIFLCEHESQGIAAQEAMAAGVPILAWDQGFVGDPERFLWGQPHIPATSVPYFDARCGLTFRDASEFSSRLSEFLEAFRARRYAPRDYILETLPVDKCARHFVEIVDAAQNRPR